MVDQYLREMTESLAEVRRATAGVMAEEKRCKNSSTRIARKQRSTRSWPAGSAPPPAARPTPACSSRRSRSWRGRAEGLTVAYEVRRPTPAKMRQMHDKLVADIEELNARKATIKAGRRGEKHQSR